MKARTAAVAVALLVGLAGLGAFGVFQLSASGGTLAEVWVTDTARDTLGNHHAPAADRVDGELLVALSVNGPGAADDCALVAVDGDPSEQWRAGVPTEHCNIHAFGDPTIADVDGDGTPEVLVATTEEVVVAYDAETGEEEFRRSLSGWGYAAPVVADVAPHPGREVVVADLRGGVYVLDGNGAVVWSTNRSGVLARPAVADFDGDGDREVAVGEGSNVTLFGPNGDVEWETPVEGTVGWMTSGSVEGDPIVVAATTDGRVVAIDGATGDPRWHHEFGVRAAVHAFGDGDGDGRQEVYAVAQDGKLRAIDAADGTVEWTTTLTTEDVQMTPPPALGDLTGDGSPELVAVSKDGTVSVVDPDSGEVLDTYAREVPIWTHPTLADVDGDGDLEALVTYGDGRVVALDFEG